jgi:hypothetical protein
MEMIQGDESRQDHFNKTMSKQLMTDGIINNFHIRQMKREAIAEFHLAFAVITSLLLELSRNNHLLLET